MAEPEFTVLSIQPYHPSDEAHTFGSLVCAFRDRYGHRLVLAGTYDYTRGFPTNRLLVCIRGAVEGLDTLLEQQGVTSGVEKFTVFGEINETKA